MSNKQNNKYPNLLKDLKISHKNQSWATDVTYIPVAKGLKDYFEFYNTWLLHQSLDYGTPYENYYKKGVA